MPCGYNQMASNLTFPNGKTPKIREMRYLILALPLVILFCQSLLAQTSVPDSTQQQMQHWCTQAQRHLEGYRFDQALQLLTRCYHKDPQTLYLLANQTDVYYRDKSIALNYYQQYLASSDSTYRQDAADRVRYLREVVHQQGGRY